MSELIPAFDWQQVVVSPWRDDPGTFFWIALMGFLVTVTCGLVGNYLILRRMALVGDAISHSVLPGLALAFLAAYAISASQQGPDVPHEDLRKPLLMFAGALAAGILTAVLIEWIHTKSRVKQDAAIGITFSSLFAFGVILISLFASRIDLDQDCVLYGEIGYVPLELGPGDWVPPSVLRMGIVALLTVVWIVVFYKELLVSSFDPGLAASLGINATLVHYAMMCWLSVVVVSAFESVGAILVIAMLVFPGATASMLARRLPAMLLWTVLQAALSSLLGLHLSLWLDCYPAGAMAVAAAGLFVVAWVAAPREGLLATWWRRRQMALEEPSIPEPPALGDGPMNPRSD